MTTGADGGTGAGDKALSFRASMVLCVAVVAASVGGALIPVAPAGSFAVDRGKWVIQTGVLCVAAMFAVVAMIACRSFLESIKSEIDHIFERVLETQPAPADWYAERLGFFRFSLANAVAAVAVGTLATVGYVLIDWIPSNDSAVLSIGYAITFSCGAVAGSALWVLFRGVRFLNQFGKTYAPRLTGHKFGVRLLGRQILKCYALIVLTVGTYELTSFLGWGTGTPVASMFLGAPMLFLGYPVAAFLFWSFVYCQYSMHRRLRRDKMRRVRLIESRISALHTGVPEEDENNRDVLAFHNAELQHVLTMPEWPCDTAAMAQGVAISLAGTALPVLVDRGLESLIGVA